MKVTADVGGTQSFVFSLALLIEKFNSVEFEIQ